MFGTGILYLFLSGNIPPVLLIYFDTLYPQDLYIIFLVYFFIDFREEEGEIEISIMRIIDHLPLACPPMGIEPTTWACDFDQN